MATFTGNNLDNNIGGTSGADLIFGRGGNDTLRGAAGNDTLNGGSGNDSLVGGAGNDVYVVDAAGDRVREASVAGGIDTVQSRISYVLGANLENLALTGSAAINGTGNGLSNKLTGNAGKNVLDGGAGDDSLDGGRGNDSLVGGAGNDRLIGGTGNDSLVGGLDRDTLEGGVGNDTLDGGDGRDQVRYTDALAAVIVNLETGIASDGSGGTDTLANFEHVRGSQHDDTLIGTASVWNSVFYGDDGADFIDGHGGGRAAYYDAPIGVVANLATGTASDGLGNQDTLVNLLGLEGSQFDDALTGDGGNNHFQGNGGNDTIDGGAGVDQVWYLPAATGVVVDLAAGTALDGQGGTDTLVNIEEVEGSLNSDQITGTVAANSIFGLDGDDTLVGGGGNDLLLGDAGDDVLAVSDLSFSGVHGGAGSDTLRLDGAGLSLSGPVPVSSIERIDITGTGNNSLTVSVTDVLDTSDTDQLIVAGDAGDQVTATGGWSSNGQQVIDGQVYNAYSAGSASLLVDADITQNVVA